MVNIKKIFYLNYIFIAFMAFTYIDILCANEEFIALKNPLRIVTIELDEKPTGNLSLELPQNPPEQILGSKKIRILSLDGGGVRGIIEARILEHIEENTGKPISEIFHLVGGTSSGGILATVITTPSFINKERPKYSARDLVNILRERSKELFSPNHNGILDFISLFPSLGILTSKYSSKSFRKVAEKYVGLQTTHDTLIPTAVLTYNMTTQDFKVITSWEEPVFSKVDAMSATSAAASFFSPCSVKPLGEKGTYTLSDGGTGANNPTITMILKARELYPDADEFEVVSIGSGKVHKSLKFKKMENAGIVQWSPHLAGIFINAQVDRDHLFVKEVFSPRNSKSTSPSNLFTGDYTRWSPELNPQNSKLDNTNEINLEELVKAADDYIDQHQNEFNDLINRLSVDKNTLYPTKMCKCQCTTCAKL